VQTIRLLIRPEPSPQAIAQIEHVDQVERLVAVALASEQRVGRLLVVLRTKIGLYEVQRIKGHPRLEGTEHRLRGGDGLPVARIVGPQDLSASSRHVHAANRGQRPFQIPRSEHSRGSKDMDPELLLEVLLADGPRCNRLMLQLEALCNL